MGRQIDGDVEGGRVGMTAGSLEGRPRERGTTRRSLIRRLGTGSGWSLMVGIAFVGVAIVVGLPLGWLVAYSVRDASGSLTLANFVEAYSKPEYLIPLFNSLRLGVSVTVLTTLIGVPLAWLCGRTDMPGRGALRILIYLSFILPAFVGTVAWVYLAGRRGPFNGVTGALFGVTPFNPYTLNSLAVIMALFLYPYVFMFTSNAFENMGSELEEAAAICGARPLRRVLTILLPMATPAIVSAMLLSFLQAVALYGPAALVAVPAGHQVLTTRMFTFFQRYPTDVNLAAAYGSPLVGAAVLMLLARRRLMGRRQYVSVGGRGFRSAAPHPLGAWRWPIALASWSFIGLALGLPMAALAYLSLVRNRFANLRLTLANYHWAWTEGREAILNSIKYAAIAASLCVVVGFLVAYMANRRRNTGTRTLETIATVPIAIPGIILSVGIFAAYSRPPIALYGTAAILIVAFICRFLPIALQAIHPAVGSIHPELEETSRILGAGSVRTLSRITMPLTARSLLAAWVFTFVLSTQELAAAVLLVTVGTSVVSTTIVDMYGEGLFERVSALGLSMVVVTFLLVAVGTLVTRGQLISRRAGGS